MNPQTQGQMLASLVVVLDAAGLGASLVAKKDRRESANRRDATRAGGRRAMDWSTDAPAGDAIGESGVPRSPAESS